MQRKLDTHRLYRLTKIVVIIVTILSIAIALLTNYQRFSYQFGYDEAKYSFQAAIDCSKNYSKDADVNRCLDEETKPWRDTENLANNSALIAIFLPLIFFGGGWIYKYLFPTVHKKEN